ncbi:MAG: amidohydrolase, partial [Proteobacteria bacterium]|nr:amidohydrolase [Pseudomonadota bacterium]
MSIVSNFNSHPLTLAALCMIAAMPIQLAAQDNLTPNGIADNRQNAFAFTNANIYQPNGNILANGTLLIREGRVIEISTGESVPDGYFEIDISGHYIYPGFIDIYTKVGIPELEREGNRGGAENLFSSDQALNVNDAIRSNFRASSVFTPDEEVSEKFRKLGFSTVLSLRPDGIARGTSALITLGDGNANKSIIIPDSAAHYSLSKGTSTQAMPSSLMGSYALLRQTYLDAAWFDSQMPRPFTDDTLEAWNRYQSLPQIMEVNNWQQALIADQVGDEFETQYILKTAGDSYKRADLVKATDATLIVPVDFPDAPAIDDAIAAEHIAADAIGASEIATNAIGASEI